jgi:hypothetical protein
MPEPGGSSLDDDRALRYVDPNNRIEVDRFERLDEAELACGLLRFNGIACELSPLPLPGLPADIILWIVDTQPGCQTRVAAACRRGAPSVPKNQKRRRSVKVGPDHLFCANVTALGMLTGMPGSSQPRQFLFRPGRTAHRAQENLLERELFA